MQRYQKVLERWQKTTFDTQKRERQIALLSKKFLKYKLNVFILERHALTIQHWYFRTKVRKAQEFKKKSEQELKVAMEKYSPKKKDPRKKSPVNKRNTCESFRS